MVQHAVVRTGKLDVGWVIAPERYDPRRTPGGQDGSLLRDLATIVSATVVPGSSDGRRYLVLDTTDAAEGFIRIHRGSRSRERLGSAKKTAKPGDVVISRLRPYLRQVGYVDAALGLVDDHECVIAFSTEFFVIRATGEPGIGFLVPFLLSDGVQRILAVSQEGGHHPRINGRTIEQLVVPNEVLETRVTVSSEVEAAINLARRSEQTMRRLTGRKLASYDETDVPPDDEQLALLSPGRFGDLPTSADEAAR